MLISKNTNNLITLLHYIFSQSENDYPFFILYIIMSWCLNSLVALNNILVFSVFFIIIYTKLPIISFQPQHQTIISLSVSTRIWTSLIISYINKKHTNQFLDLRRSFKLVAIMSQIHHDSLNTPEKQDALQQRLVIRAQNRNLFLINKHLAIKSIYILHIHLRLYSSRSLLILARTL